MLQFYLQSLAQFYMNSPCPRCDDREEPSWETSVWINGIPASGHLLQAFEELDDCEAEADQRDRRPYPRHHRALEAQAGADPAKVAVCGYSYLEPTSAWGGVCVCHAGFLIADLTIRVGALTAPGPERSRCS
jgi:hypothetical protein